MQSKGQTAAKVIGVILVLLLLAGIVAVIYRFTNGFNEDFKTFYVEYDGEQILKQMALGPFGGLFIFGRIIEGAGSNYGTSLAPIEQLTRPLRNTKNLLFDAGQFDAEKALEDLDKLAKSLLPLYRDGKKLYENLTD